MILYYPNRQDNSQVLSLFSTQWTISNFKSTFNSSKSLSKATVLGVRESQLLRAFADGRLRSYDGNCHAVKFTLTVQKNDVLVKTSKFCAALFEEKLKLEMTYVQPFNCRATNMWEELDNIVK